MNNPITQDELKELEHNVNFKWSTASSEERRNRIRLLQRVVSLGEFEIKHIQNLEIRAYEIATDEEKAALRAMDNEYPALLAGTKTLPKEPEKTEAEKFAEGLSKAKGIPYEVALEKAKVLFP